MMIISGTAATPLMMALQISALIGVMGEYWMTKALKMLSVMTI